MLLFFLTLPFLYSLVFLIPPSPPFISLPPPPPPPPITTSTPIPHPRPPSLFSIATHKYKYTTQQNTTQHIRNHQ